MFKLKGSLIYLVCFLITLLFYHFIYGFASLNPLSNNWLLAAYHDWGSHYLGWENFRNEPWSFPIGQISNYNYPAGSNIGFTDSIPLMAIFFKFINFILPETFQYFGIWFFLSHLITGIYTVKIIKIYSKNNFYAILAFIIIAFNPILLYRGMHPALCAQWLLVASIYYYLLKPTVKTAIIINQKQLLLIIISSLIHPYLFLMTVGFNIILPLKNYWFDKVLSFKKALFFIITSLLSVLLSWYILGILTYDNVSLEVANSYGLYSSNLNSFFNANGFSKFIPQLESAKIQQYEGFAYLGVGMMVLFFMSFMYYFLTLIIHKRNIIKNRAFLWLMVISFLLTIFAITNIITFGEATILEFQIPEIIIKVGNIFRASGRFMWLTYYLIFFFGILIFIKINVSDKIKIPVLIFLTGLQIYDSSPMMFRDLKGGEFISKKIQQSKWVKITSNFDRIITYPPFENNLLNPLDYQDLCFVALKNSLPITCGYVARDIGLINNKFKDTLNLNISESALLSDNDIYITTPTNVDAFIPLLYNKKLKLRFLDGYYYLFSSNHKIKAAINQEEKDKIDIVNKQIQNSSKFEKISNKIEESNTITLGIEKNSLNENVFQCNGWAFVNGTDSNKNDSIFILLTNEKNSFRIKTKSIARPDVTASINRGNLDNSGFNATIFTDKIEKGSYDVFIGIRSKKTWNYKKLDQKLELVTILPPKVLSEKFKTTTNKKTIGNIEDVNIYKNHLYVNGWAGFENENSSNSIIRVIIYNPKYIYQIETQKILRNDVTTFNKNKFNYDNTGFKSKTNLNYLKRGKYKISVYIKNSQNQSNYFTTDKEIVIK